MSLNLVTPPAVEPVSLDEAKQHLRLDHDEDDALIAAQIVAARQYAEALNGRVFITQTWELTLSEFRTCIDLPKIPVGAIDGITYIDAAGASQTVDPATYQLVRDRFSARLVPKYGLAWPTALDQLDAVTITWTAGYGDADDVPGTVKQGILLLIAHMYENREGVTDRPMSPVPMAIDAMLSIDRVVTFA